MVSAVTAGYRPGDFEAIGITASPCGGCRQWLHEFGFDEVSYPRGDGSLATMSPSDLLPDTWTLPGPA
jgi:cytidine deaminase